MQSATQESALLRVAVGEVTTQLAEMRALNAETRSHALALEHAWAEVQFERSARQKAESLLAEASAVLTVEGINNGAGQQSSSRTDEERVVPSLGALFEGWPMVGIWIAEMRSSTISHESAAIPTPVQEMISASTSAAGGYFGAAKEVLHESGGGSDSHIEASLEQPQCISSSEEWLRADGWL